MNELHTLVDYASELNPSLGESVKQCWIWMTYKEKESEILSQYISSSRVFFSAYSIDELHRNIDSNLSHLWLIHMVEDLCNRNILAKVEVKDQIKYKLSSQAYIALTILQGFGEKYIS